MAPETAGIVAGVVVALLAGLKALLPYLSKRPKLAAALAALLIISVVVLSALVLSGCRSSIPVVVKNQNFQCSTVVTNEDGEVDFDQSDCIRGDGTGEQVDSAGGDGDDEVEVPLPNTTREKAGLRLPGELPGSPEPAGSIALRN